MSAVLQVVEVLAGIATSLFVSGRLSFLVVREFEAVRRDAEPQLLAPKIVCDVRMPDMRPSA